MRHSAQGITGGWVMLGLIFKRFPFCEFSYLILPRVSYRVRVSYSRVLESVIPLQCPGLCLCYVILSKLLNVAKHQLHQQQSTDWKYLLVLHRVFSCQSINEVCMKNSNSELFFHEVLKAPHQQIMIMLAISFHNCWFPWLESHLWRLGKLGS